MDELLTPLGAKTLRQMVLTEPIEIDPKTYDARQRLVLLAVTGAPRLRESIWLVRWRRDNGRLTSKLHALCNPDAVVSGATFFPTECGLEAPIERLGKPDSEINELAFGKVEGVSAGNVCGICAHAAMKKIDLGEIARRFIERGRWTNFDRPTASAFIKNVV